MSLRQGALLLILLAVAMPLISRAESATSTAASDIQRQIDDNNAQIAQLDKEIAQYQSQLNTTTKQKNTLQNQVNQLTLQSKQLTAKITVTKSQIKTTQLQIQQLGQGIAAKAASIDDEQSGLAQSIRRLNTNDRVPLVASVLSANNVSDLWDDADAAMKLQGAIKGSIVQLSQDKQVLSNSKTAAETKQAQLLAQQRTLAAQQGSLDATKRAQSDLLAQTKNQEANYQSIIAQKQAAKKDFEDTLNALQAKLKAADTSSVPIAGSVLSWPLDSVFVTQYFGNTEFARTAAYKGQGHNGIDLRASIGTPVKAALYGTVEAINLGTAPNCQYGKWVLIKHNNGLTTLYAHLSSIAVSDGQGVTTGQIIGYSGNTGYATGPHLHFTVYASAGVSFVNYRCNSGKVVNVPVSPFNGYLNPILYLPAS